MADRPPTDRRVTHRRIDATTMTADRADELLAAYRSTGDRRARDEVIEGHLRLAQITVRRFARGNAELAEDLHQVAMIGVVHASERFRPGMGASFRTFANRTIEGELKRYLRDRTWIVRPPRTRQERYLHMCRAQEELTQRLGRSPTVREIGEEIDLTPDQVIECMEAGNARRSASMDSVHDPDDNVTVRPEVVRWDPGYGAFEAHDDLIRAIGSLDGRQRHALHLRFIDELSQPEIARRLGLSQSYVSRIIRAALDDLRTDMDGRPSTAADGRAPRSAECEVRSS